MGKAEMQSFLSLLNLQVEILQSDSFTNNKYNNAICRTRYTGSLPLVNYVCCLTCIVCITSMIEVSMGP